MTVAEMINRRIEDLGQSERGAAIQLGVTRQTLINWRKGVFLPDPRDQERIGRLALWAGESEAHLIAMILAEKGVDTSIFEEMAAFAKGVYVSSFALVG